jgi:hypothetical protein
MVELVLLGLACDVARLVRHARRRALGRRPAHEVDEEQVSIGIGVFDVDANIRFALRVVHAHAGRLGLLVVVLRHDGHAHRHRRACAQEWCRRVLHAGVPVRPRRRGIAAECVLAEAVDGRLARRAHLARLGGSERQQQARGGAAGGAGPPQ